MARPNRLEQYWSRLVEAILCRWDHVQLSDLEKCKYRYDDIVEIIRQTYHRGRSHITMEADIRDWLNNTIANLEKETEYDKKDKRNVA